jgi:flap endonuclease-1
MGVAIRDLILDYRRDVPWESLGGVAAVDAHNALYQFLSIIRQPDGTPLMDRQGRITSHLSGILFRNANFLARGIRPVYVFDGEPPVFKSATIEERRNVRAEAGERWQEALARGDKVEAYKQARASSRVDATVISTSKRLLSLMGIPFVEAPSEGEAQAAFMVQQGDAGYAVSQDYDSLLFGVPTLVRNLTISGKRKIHGRTVTLSPEKIQLVEVLKGLAITREQLIDLGILVGTDFNPGIHGIGPKTGLKKVLAGEFDSIIHEKAPDFDPDPIREFFLSPPVNSGYRLAWRKPDTDGISEMLCREYDFDPGRVSKVLGEAAPRPGQKTLDAWF